MLNQYPYLNINDLNLDFILNAIREMKYEVTNFVSINAIKYADPIQWNITSQYEKNTIVIDPVTGTAYISVAPVPSGVSLTRTEYWTVVFDLGSFVTRAAQNFTSHWESETTTTATFPTTTGGWLVWGDVLYRALTNITAGDTYVVDGNIEHFTIEDLYNAYLNMIADILAMVGDLADLETSDKTSVVNAINELHNDTLPLPVLDVTKHGVSTNNIDNCTALQNCINDYSSDYCIYIPAGIYRFTNTVTFPDELRLKCDGSLVFTLPNSTDVAIIDIGVDQVIEIASLISNQNAIELRATTKSIGRNRFVIPHIRATNGDAITLHSNGTNASHGVQKCVFELNSLWAGRYGIFLYAESAIYNDWVNENNFYNMWITAGVCAIKSIKGINQTDPYNGNRFVNFSTESSAKAIDIEFARSNLFDNLRCFEIVGLGNQIIFAGNTQDNIIRFMSELREGDIIDAGTGNYYHGHYRTLTPTSYVMCDAFTFRWGSILPLLSNSFNTGGRGKQLLNQSYSCQYEPITSITASVTDGGTYNINLPLIEEYMYTWQPIFISIPTNNGLVNIRTFNGVTLASTDKAINYIVVGGGANSEYSIFSLNEFPEFLNTTTELTLDTNNISSGSHVRYRVWGIGTNGTTRGIEINGTILGFGVIATGTIYINTTCDFPIFIDGKLYMLTVSPTSVSIGDPFNNGLPAWDVSRALFF